MWISVGRRWSFSSHHVLILSHPTEESSECRGQDSYAVEYSGRFGFEIRKEEMFYGYVERLMFRMCSQNRSRLP